MTSDRMKRIREIEDALVDTLRRRGFEIVHDGGERFAAPDLIGHVDAEYIWSRPLYSVFNMARDIEASLS